MIRHVFFSFDYDKDVFRIQQLRNMDYFDDGSLFYANKWEEVKRKDDRSIEKWIDDNMSGKSCVIVLIGTDTANSRWVRYEIKKAVMEKKAIFGIYIHHLKDPRWGTCMQGGNPFHGITCGGKNLADIVKCYDPDPLDSYGDIKNNIQLWIERAMKAKIS